MKKIMFNDRYGLTQAVLEGRKTQTRRTVTYPKTFHGKDVCGFYVCKRVSDGVVTEVCMYDENESFIDEGQIVPNYKVGEIVAIAQSYKDCGYKKKQYTRKEDSGYGYLYSELVNEIPMPWPINGFSNKMFVKPELMPHQIRITNVSIERLKDISDEDCLAEGIYPYYYGDAEEKKRYDIPPNGYSFDGIDYHYPTPREAYAALIDKVSGKGTWESSPYVFVYDFELVK